MKPTKLNKLTKKELRKLYTLQWRNNNRIAGELAQLEIAYHAKERILEITEQALQSAEHALKYKEGEISHKDRLLKSLIES